MFEVLKYVEFLPFSCECGFWRFFWVSVVLLDFLFVWFGFWVYFFPKRGEKTPIGNPHHIYCSVVRIFKICHLKLIVIIQALNLKQKKKN